MFYCPGCKAAVAAETLYCEKCGYNQKTSPPPKQSSRLIRPIGVLPPEQSNVTAIPTNSMPIPPDATPAHLLALTPMTPLRMSAQRPSSPPPLRQPARQQFIRPNFVRSQRQEPRTLGVPQAKEAQLQQNTPPEQPTTLDDFEGYDEGYVATSQAAERWRTSWHQRQRSEAGPATEVSRGQSLVPEPLMSMQHSFARIRAIVAPQQQSHAQRVKRRFWTTIVLMLCLIGSLIGYIIWTYLPAAGTTQHIDPPANAPLPSLSMQARPVASIKQGQMLHLHE